MYFIFIHYKKYKEKIYFYEYFFKVYSIRYFNNKYNESNKIIMRN